MSRCMIAVVPLIVFGLVTWDANADLNHIEALEIARTAVPAGTPAVQIQDEIFDGVEDTFEARFIINGGRQVADVEVDRRTGEIVQFDEANQSPAKRTLWRQILDGWDTVNISYDRVYRKVLKKYPDAAIYQINIDIGERGLEYDVVIEDAQGRFQLEVEAESGLFDFLVDRGKTFKQAITTAESKNPTGTLIDIKINGRGTVYTSKLLKSNAKKLVTVKINARTGRVKSTSTKATKSSQRAAFREIVDQANAASISVSKSLVLARRHHGGGRPTRVKLILQGGLLKYQTQHKIASERRNAKVDAQTGDI